MNEKSVTPNETKEATILDDGNKNKNIIEQQISIINFLPPEILKQYKDIDPELLPMFRKNFDARRNHNMKMENTVIWLAFFRTIISLLLIGFIAFFVENIKIVIPITAMISAYLFRTILTNILKKK